MWNRDCCRSIDLYLKHSGRQFFFTVIYALLNACFAGWGVYASCFEGGNALGWSLALSQSTAKVATLNLAFVMLPALPGFVKWTENNLALSSFLPFEDTITNP